MLRLHFLNRQEFYFNNLGDLNFGEKAATYYFES